MFFHMAVLETLSLLANSAPDTGEERFARASTMEIESFDMMKANSLSILMIQAIYYYKGCILSTGES